MTKLGKQCLGASVTTLFSFVDRLVVSLAVSVTGGSRMIEDYAAIRNQLVVNNQFAALIPDELRQFEDSEGLIAHLEMKGATFSERRGYVFDAFSDLLNYLDRESRSRGVKDTASIEMAIMEEQLSNKSLEQAQPSLLIVAMERTFAVETISSIASTVGYHVTYLFANECGHASLSINIAAHCDNSPTLAFGFLPTSRTPFPDCREIEMLRFLEGFLIARLGEDRVVMFF